MYRHVYVSEISLILSATMHCTNSLSFAEQLYNC